MSDPRPTATPDAFAAELCQKMLSNLSYRMSQICDQMAAAIRGRDIARDAASDAREDRLREALLAVVASYSLAPVKSHCDGGCGSSPGAGCLASDVEHARETLAAIPPGSDR